MTRNSGEHLALETGDNGIGDVTTAAAEPLLETAFRRINVVINVGVAHDEDRPDAIAIAQPPGRLTAAQAHQLAVDLGRAADWVADIRRGLGYDQ